MKIQFNTQLKVLLAYILLAVVLCIMASCNGCKQKPVENVVAVIEQAHNPKIDSLKYENALFKDSLLKLNKELAKQKTKTAIAENKASATAKRLQEALSKKDTSKIINYADDIIEEYDAYIQATIRQDSIQEAVIEKQAAAIVNSRAEIELHESKYNLLKTAYEVKKIEANDWKKEAHKFDRKLKRAKFFNKVLGIGAAAGAVLAGIVFL